LLAPKPILIALLGAAGIAFVVFWIRHARGAPGRRWPSVLHVAIGALTNFFDTLGIGSFATTTSIYKMGGFVADEDVPGTLNVGHMLPTFAEAFIYIKIVEVDPTTLISMIGASVAGAWLGAGVVARWSRRRIQAGMGVLLVVAAAIMIARATGRAGGGGEALGLSGARLAIAIAGNFALGALMTLGIGLFAPCMILVALLGMHEKAAFPIMMGSCAFLMPAASVRFVRSGRYNLRASIGLALGGLPAVLVAAHWFDTLSLETVKWLVVVVVVYTALAMLRSAVREGRREGRDG
jgi:uncharacterized membrane protein YfcA